MQLRPAKGRAVVKAKWKIGTSGHSPCGLFASTCTEYKARKFEEHRVKLVCWRFALTWYVVNCHTACFAVKDVVRCGTKGCDVLFCSLL